MAVTDAQLAVLTMKLDAVLAAEAQTAATLRQIQAWQINHDLTHARSDASSNNGGGNGNGSKIVPVLVDVVKMLATALLTLLGYSQMQHFVR